MCSELMVAPCKRVSSDLLLLIIISCASRPRRDPGAAVASSGRTAVRSPDALVRPASLQLDGRASS